MVRVRNFHPIDTDFHYQRGGPQKGIYFLKSQDHHANFLGFWFSPHLNNLTISKGYERFSEGYSKIQTNHLTNAIKMIKYW